MLHVVDNESEREFRDFDASEQGPPPLVWTLLEGQRALFEGLSLGPAAPLLARAPTGDGHPVLFLPGFMAGDRSTRVLRRYARRLGYSAHPWLLGVNVGMEERRRERLRQRVDDLYRRHGRKLTLVGWSLGGIYAREIAKRMPEKIRRVVTLGSPFADAGRASSVSRLFETIWGRDLSEERIALARQLRVPPDVPSTAIYSRTDGVVHWSSCLEPEAAHTENIEVPGSHCGLGVNALVLYAIADRLCQAEGEFAPFDRSGWRRHVYR